MFSEDGYCSGFRRRKSTKSPEEFSAFDYTKKERRGTKKTEGRTKVYALPGGLKSVWTKMLVRTTVGKEEPSLKYRKQS